MSYTTPSQTTWDHRATIEEPDWQTLQLEAEHSEQARNQAHLSPAEPLSTSDKLHNNDEGFKASLYYSKPTGLHKSMDQQQQTTGIWGSSRTLPQTSSYPQTHSLHPYTSDPLLQHGSHIFEPTVSEYDRSRLEPAMVPQMGVSQFSTNSSKVEETSGCASWSPLSVTHSPMELGFINSNLQASLAPAGSHSEQTYPPANITLQQPNNTWQRQHPRSPFENNNNISIVKFINYTARDDQKILKAVNPSGGLRTKARRQKEALERRKELVHAVVEAVMQVEGNLNKESVEYLLNNS